MKRIQIMIVFVLAVFGAAFADITPIPNTSVTSAFSRENITTPGNPSLPGENTTTLAPLSTAMMTSSSTMEPTSKQSTFTVPDNFTTANTLSAEQTSIPSVSTGTTPVITSSSPEQTTATTPCPALLGFDGASFIGGIVLALGVIVILVIIVKCYNHQTRKNESQYSQF